MNALITKFPIYTAQLNTGKVLKNSTNVLFIDVTVKSGTEPYKKLFAPSWELLSAFKKGMSFEEYSYQYCNELLSRKSDDVINYLKLIAARKTSYEAIVLACYCGNVCKCHRLLVANILATTLDVAYIGELKSHQVSLNKALVPNRTIIYALSDVAAKISTNSLLIDSWSKLGVNLLFLAKDANVNIFSTKKLDSYSNHLGGAEVFIIPTDCDYIPRREVSSDDAILNLLQKVTIYEEPTVINSTESLNTYIKSRCFIPKHQITI